MMVWLALCAYLIIILGSFAAVFNDNHHQDTPTAFDSTSSTYNSETAVAISALFHNYSYEIGYVKHIKAYLLIYLLLLIGFYLFAFWSAIRFLGTFDTPGFRITNKTAKYLENLSGSLVFIYFILWYTKIMYASLAEMKPEYIYFEYSQLGNVSITLLLTSLFLGIVAKLLKRSAELQEEVEGTI